MIEWQLDETLDVNGWDVQKALRLLQHANPTLFEWNSSPIVYRTTEAWKKISAVADEYFVRKAGLFHYLNTAQDNYRDYLTGERVKLKKYFYVLRPILACKWILEKGTPPPMPFRTLAERYLEGEVKEEVEALLKRKTSAPETGTGKRIASLNAYIEQNLALLENAVSALPNGKERDWERLNELFFISFLKKQTRPRAF